TAPAAGTKTSGLGLWRNAVELTVGAVGIGSPELSVGGRRYTPYSAAGEPLPGGPVQPYSVRYTMLPIAASGSHDIAASPAMVLARYNASGSGMSVHLTLEEAPVAGPFKLSANNSVSAQRFPLFANSSYPNPAEGPAGPTRVWSLRNWLVGPDATVQVDFRDGLVLAYGRDGNRTAWLSQAAPEGASSLEYRLSVFGPGDPLYGQTEPVTIEGPLRRAGGFLSTLGLNGSRQVLTQWAFGLYPWARDSSSLPPGYFEDPAAMPPGRAQAHAWLVEHIEYVVVVNATDDPMLAAFPELAKWESDENFSLAFTSVAPPDAAAEPLVWVYRVNRGDGALTAAWGASLRFGADQSGPDPAGGLEVWFGSQDLTAGARGIGFPTALVNGTPYIAASASFAFEPGNRGRTCTAVWTLYEEVGGLPVPSAPLTVRATYRLNGSLLSVNFTATQIPTGALWRLGATTQVNATRFPVYVNDTAWTNESSDTAVTPIGSLRNWLVAPGVAALQVDYRDPLLLYYERESAGTASLSYEAPDGSPWLAYDIWVIPAAGVPYP
ncbi:MAG TPA: hypothetical protein VI796_05175, partial [Candidatus Thermoplasmatota archaeon]|nr:hypothetical protein [Candidatus Thermoplasmatota archaeon]